MYVNIVIPFYMLMSCILSFWPSELIIMEWRRAGDAQTQLVPCRPVGAAGVGTRGAPRFHYSPPFWSWLGPHRRLSLFLLSSHSSYAHSIIPFSLIDSGAHFYILSQLGELFISNGNILTIENKIHYTIELVRYYSMIVIFKGYGIAIILIEI